MRRRINRLLKLAAWLCCGLILAAGSSDPFAAIPAQQREALKTRLKTYIKLNRSRDWSKLYDLVSDTGRAGVNRRDFVALVDAGHDRFYADSDDLLEFQPNRSEAQDGGYDIYGCATARRENEKDSGIAVVRAVFERGNWYFTGWAFTQHHPVEPCSRLSDPKWQPEDRIRWDQPMEEVRPQPNE